MKKLLALGCCICCFMHSAVAAEEVSKGGQNVYKTKGGVYLMGGGAIGGAVSDFFVTSSPVVLGGGFFGLGAEFSKNKAYIALEASGMIGGVGIEGSSFLYGNVSGVVKLGANLEGFKLYVLGGVSGIFLDFNGTNSFFAGVFGAGLRYSLSPVLELIVEFRTAVITSTILQYQVHEFDMMGMIGLAYMF